MPGGAKPKGISLHIGLNRVDSIILRLCFMTAEEKQDRRKARHEVEAAATLAEAGALDDSPRS
jgi:hypothetical protein